MEKNFISEQLQKEKQKIKLESLFSEERAEKGNPLGTDVLREDALEVQSKEKELLFLNLINVKTVAEWLGVAPKTIHNWVSLRKIPYVKVGQKVMFRPKSLKAWLNRKEIKSWL